MMYHVSDLIVCRRGEEGNPCDVIWEGVILIVTVCDGRRGESEIALICVTYFNDFMPKITYTVIPFVPESMLGSKVKLYGVWFFNHNIQTQ